MSSPLATHFKLSARMSPKMIDEHEYMSHVPYASAVGSLYVCYGVHETEFVTGHEHRSKYMHDPA